MAKTIIYTSMKEVIRLLRSLSWLKQLIVVLDSRIKGRVYICKGGFLELHSGAGIRIHTGSLTINRKWFEGDPFVSHVSLGAGAQLVVEDSFLIYSGARIHVNAGATLKLGNGYANHNVNISCYSCIEIGHNVLIAENVFIRDSDNKYIVAAGQLPEEQERLKTQPIKIGDNVWIGSNVTILKGVTIGAGAVIASGSVVNKSVAPRTLVGGVPARVLKENIEWV